MRARPWVKGSCQGPKGQRKGSKEGVMDEGQGLGPVGSQLIYSNVLLVF